MSDRPPKRGVFLRSLIPLVASVAVLVSCSPRDSERATEVFADCLNRNGVVVESVEVTLDSDGSVAGVSAVISSEGDVAYEPTVRLACTEEVEAALAG